MLAHLSGIQRAIARRTPLPRILNMITAGAHDVFQRDHRRSPALTAGYGLHKPLASQLVTPTN